MRLLGLEHGKAAYAADFVFYGLLVLTLTTLMLLFVPNAQLPRMGALALLGLVVWTLLEYLLHRFVLHGLRPFRGWHLEHHERPTALIGTPTVATAILFLMLVFVPVESVAGLWSGSAFTNGILAGFLVFSIAHHATHHWRVQGVWFRRRKYLHALHHHGQPERNFGVTTDLWDRLFGTLRVR